MITKSSVCAPFKEIDACRLAGDPCSAVEVFPMMPVAFQGGQFADERCGSACYLIYPYPVGQCSPKDEADHGARDLLLVKRTAGRIVVDSEMDAAADAEPQHDAEWLLAGKRPEERHADFFGVAVRS